MKKSLSIFLSGILTLAAIPLAGASAAEQTNEKWDRFIKYDLCIDDYSSLNDNEKALCKFIFDTEQNSPDTVICERARRTLAGDTNLGERISLSDLTECYGIWDVKSEYRSGREWFIHCVPDIIHLDETSESAYNEYWVDESGKTKISYTGKNNGYNIAPFRVTSICLNGQEASELYADHVQNYRTELQDDGTYIVTYEITPAAYPNDRMLDIDGDSYYIQDDDSVVLIESKYMGDRKKADSITVPAEVDGHKVTAISSGAFAQSSAKEIILPDTIESIGRNAFLYCSKLESINIPENLNYMGVNAFKLCENLKNVEFNCPELDLPAGTFESCTALETVKLNVHSIGEKAFDGCTSLSEVTLGDKLEKISAQAFATCEKIADLELPDSLLYIGQEAFAETAIQGIEIPQNVKLIGVLPRARGEIVGGIHVIPAYNPLNSFPDDCTIYGIKGSKAEIYAKEWNMVFIATDESLSGDANLDGSVTVADAVAILQYIGNRDKYQLTDQGKKNADVDDVEGITPNDALTIQKWDSQGEL